MATVVNHSEKYDSRWVLFGILGPWVFTIASIWQLVAMVIAIRQALDFTSTWRAVGVAMVGFIPYVVLISIIYSLM